VHATEESLEQKSFAQLRPLVVSSEVLAVVACTIVLAVANAYQHISPWLYSYCLVAGTVCYLTYRARTTQGLWLCGLLLVCTCTACLGSLALALGNPLGWFLPIGLMFGLPVSAMHAKPWQAFCTGVAVWVTLFVVMLPHYETRLDLTLTLLLIIGSLLIATMVCTELCRIRKDVFDLQHQLHAMAYRDTLTGLPNRRAFMERLTASAVDGVTPAPLFFLMLDIDDFKHINDSFGHDVGDRVLVEIAKVLREQSLGHNVARLGGEEFAVAAQLPNTAAAQELAQRIVDSVHANQLYGTQLSISVGLADHTPGETIFSLMRRADQALYDAKHEGKNRYAMATKTATNT
jgi:diguanylate cyclase (GGDEF)-like protein